MAGRTLQPDEKALWAKVVQTVEPLDRRLRDETETPQDIARFTPTQQFARQLPKRRSAPGPGKTLDGSWDRKLTRGTITPDRTVDLHGHNLTSAYDRLDHGLADAIASEARVLLLITGHPPKDRAPIERGKIRAAVGDWLAASRHAEHIAAVRAAHPRHGGRGALYIVLRRRR
ncbi:MAG: Smr/MutS family protein [Sphingomonadaceae bacterium]|nr:Smr/MutS family protein [Sphingomonadaceae bacterium]